MEMNYLKRWLKIFFVSGTLLLYLPVNRLVTGGNNLWIPFDDAIPLVPIFVFPYLLGILAWYGTIILINVRSSHDLARKFNLMMVIASVVSVLLYLILPTYITRPVVEGTDGFARILRWLYNNDRVYNAAPSGHTFYTIICCWALWKTGFNSWTKLLIAAFSLLVIVSTVFTKQHNFLDVVLGVAFACAIILIISRVRFDPSSRHTPRRVYRHGR
jgi:membrane-associated phospholipid phosphatase